MKWGIYYRDREYARVAGDPLLCIVEAESKNEAEILAWNSNLSSYNKTAGLWASPLKLPNGGPLAEPRRVRKWIVQVELPAGTLTVTEEP